MSPELRHFAGLVFHGWWELFTLFVLLWLAALLMGWAANRGLRPVERAAPVNGTALLAAFALMVVVRHVRADHVDVIIAAAGLVLAAFIASRSGTRSPVLPLMLLGALLGLGLNLSAIVLTVMSILVLFFTRARSK